MTLAPLQLLLGEISDAAAIVSADGDERVLAANEAFATLVGLPERVLVAKALAELAIPGDFERTVRPLPAGEGEALELLVLRARDRRSGLTAKELARALLESEERLRIALTLERDAMSIIDVESGCFIDVNDAWVRQYGYTREEALSGMKPTSVSAEPDATRDAILARATDASVGGLVRRWHKRRDGTEFPVEIACGNVTVGGRRAVYAVLRDISEQVAADEAIRRSETRFRTLIEGMPEGVVVEREGRLVYVNPAARALLGLSADGDAYRGREVRDLVHPDERDAVAAHLAAVETEGTGAVAGERRLVRSDGTIVMVETTSLVVSFDGEPAVLCILRDVSARKQMEARLITADRLASLGRLAASVGHEINNPLAFVLANAEIARRELGELAGAVGPSAPELVARIARRIEAIERGGERVRDIVRDLKTLTRTGSDVEIGPVDLRKSLELCADIAAHEIRYRATLTKHFEEGLYALGNEGRLGQVFLNLLVNAAEAIDEGNVAANEVRIRTRRLSGDRVAVEVEDTGVGIPEDIAPHLFEPFVTTKGSRGGTGLGLSICHHIVQSHEGSIEVERLSPRGTRFRVVLPAARVSSASIAVVPPSILEVRAHRSRILVVDDEPDITAILARVLRHYDVAVACSGREALQILSTDTFDAVLCDLMMGDMTGMDVYDHVAKTRPGDERRIVFMTGGAFTHRARDFLDSVSNPRLTKPFDVDEADAALRTVIEDPAAAE